MFDKCVICGNVLEEHYGTMAFCHEESLFDIYSTGEREGERFNWSSTAGLDRKEAVANDL